MNSEIRGQPQLGMIGAFLGAASVLQSALFVFVLGGAAAVIFAISRKATRLLAMNLRDIALAAVTPGMPWWRPRGTAVSVGRMPYGVYISVGTIVFLVVRQLNFIAV